MRKSITFIIICFLAVAYSWSQDGSKRPIYLIYIGNSITQGAIIDNPEDNAPPVQASHYLSKQTAIELRGFSNQGVSGMTTIDFLPAQQTLFPNVVEAAKPFANDKKAVLIFSIMLGTNDSAIKGPNGSPVSPVQYYTNLQAIINELLILYPKAICILHRPIWYSPNTYNRAMYLQEGLDRLISYTDELNRLVATFSQTHPKRVFCGDMEAFDYFKANYATELIPENGNAGTFYLHPNLSGAARLGTFWGKSIYKVIKENQL